MSDLIENKNSFTKKCDEEKYRQLRETFYECRNFELSTSWQKTIFLTTFIVLDFTAFSKVLGVKCNSLNIGIEIPKEYVLIFLSVIGLFLSLIWMGFVKESRYWYEIYADAIFSIETDLGIERKYKMGQLLHKQKQSSNIFSPDAYIISSSKLNHYLGFLQFVVWCVLGIIPLVKICEGIKISNKVLLIIIFIIFFSVLLCKFGMVFRRGSKIKPLSSHYDKKSGSEISENIGNRCPKCFMSLKKYKYCPGCGRKLEIEEVKK